MKQRLILLLLVLGKFILDSVCAYVVQIYLNTEMRLYKRLFLCIFLTAIGNAAYKVPPHLVEMVQEENARLQQRRWFYIHSHTQHWVFYAILKSSVSYRAEFDASSNSVEVRLHLAPHYHYQNGALHPVSPDEDSIITVTFDRRKTVGDLRLAIYQVTSLIYF